MNDHTELSRQGAKVTTLIGSLLCQSFGDVVDDYYLCHIVCNSDKNTTQRQGQAKDGD